MSKVFNLNFKGYWRDCNKKGIPDVSGIYVVYNCTYNSEKDTVSLNEIIYIGQAENINERVSLHDKRELFIKKCSGEDNICYAITEVHKDDIDLVENALVYAQQPPLNDKLKDKFNYPMAEFHIEGRCALMKHKDFTIR